MWTWADADENTPGYVEIHMVGHEAETWRGVLFHPDGHRHRHRLDREPDGAEQGADAYGRAIAHVIEHLPFPIRGIDLDNGSEFINAHLLRYCTDHDLKFTSSAPGHKNDGTHVEQENWTAVHNS